MYYSCVFIFFIFVIKLNDIESIAHLKEDVDHYRNIWMVLISGNSDIADKIAKLEGFILEEEDPEFPKLFQFRHTKLQDQERYENEELTRRLKSHPEVIWAYQLAAIKVNTSQRKTASKKDKYLPHQTSFAYLTESIVNHVQCFVSQDQNAVSRYQNFYNDPFFPAQWYLHDCRPPKSNDPIDHINVVRVWKEYKYFGKGIVVVVVDEGVETNHVDLKNNYSKLYSYDYLDNDPDPNPVHYSWNVYNHGIQTAGVIAMSKNNKICGVGIAPEVTFGAIRLLGPRHADDRKYSKAFLYNYKEIHIMNNSWNPYDNGVSAQGLSPLIQNALKTGATIGRKNKGVIYVFSAGNGKEQNDMCGCDAYVNNLYTITVASCDIMGLINEYSERCAAVMVTAYSNTDHFPYGVVSTDYYDQCTVTFGGTSAAAPIVSSAIALTLEARPDLTQRDIQHLLVCTSEMAAFRRNKFYNSLTANAAGFYYTPDFGFGMINIYGLVTKAKTFVLVPPMSTCVQEIIQKGHYVHFGYKGIKLEANTNACKGKITEINYIEHVQILISVTYSRRGDLQIQLESPSKTKITVLEPRIKDNNRYGFHEWTFDSLHAWGEKPRGIWKISIFDRNAWWMNSGFVYELKLIIHGTKKKPDHYDNDELCANKYNK